MVNVEIDGKAVAVQNGMTILEAAESAGIAIPHLCYLKEINEIGACRVCVVEVEGMDRLTAACNTLVQEGMVIHTDSPAARKARRVNLQLLLSQHNMKCPICIRSGNCDLQKLATDLNILEIPYQKDTRIGTWDKTAPLIRDESKCIKCMRCVQICDKVQSLGVWDMSGTGGWTTLNVSGDRTIREADCAFCGQCITHCPTGALMARDDTQRVIEAIENPDVITVVQVAPAVRSAWAEMFHMSHKEATPNRMAAALKALGFDYVFDTNFAADLTIMEEGSEFIERFTHREQYQWPMFTSCCPGWVRFMKSQYPAYTDNLSSAKSPQQMFGAVVKSYFAEKLGVDPHRIFSVSVMPCSSKKSECELPTMRDACGDPDVDVVITTREFDRLLRAKSIKPQLLQEVPFDSPLGTGTGAAVVFGVTGGVMDAALRSAYYLLNGRNPDADAFTAVRGIDGWKEATFNIPGAGEVRTAVVSGLGNARKLMEALQSGDAAYDFVEVMACPGGCVGGGGQPIVPGQEMAESRGRVLWGLDRSSPIRYSHQNPDVQTLYTEFLGSPLSKRAHHLLHTDHHGWEMPGKIK